MTTDTPSATTPTSAEVDTDKLMEFVFRAVDEVGATLSCALVHLGEIAYLTRGRLEFDAEAGRFVDCDEANALLSKGYRSPYALPAVG